ncbi:ABC transporter substrate-binding protein [Sphingopyxis sp. SE2]|jgi:iron complex transport system substrate-binding protein|uniref:ABC transporter substrate-binding protein n=1 Tax=Sphingopyxis sp. SE2 TaxID=1586240 RepID=UPI0028C158C9|nr:ABC transporter substrate-binding protein [Sphingopyxis sp. SE2]MDT7527437.1 ABC transporter substrate-binding protein [Sphingopyxis sp. SE2]
MRRRGLLAAAALLAGGAGLLWAASSAPPVKAPAVPQRIVSINLCADQLVLALADRKQIAGLTKNATDAEMSGEAGAARGLPLLSNSAEQILAIEPDLIVGMPASRSAALRALPPQHYPLLDLATANTLGEIYTSIRKTAAAVGHPERGTALIARMERELAGLPKPGKGRVAAYYQRRGYMTGTGTLIDEMMARIGLVNLAGKLGKPPLSQLSLEEMVAAEPDFLIVESATDVVTDQGSEMLHHPAIKDIPRISIAQAWTVCGSPAYTRAARSMAAQIARHDGGRS